MTTASLSEQDISQIERSNSTEAAYPDHSTIVDLIYGQVKQAPDRVAVSFEGQLLTYGELWERSSRLARHLLSMGVSSETLVAICVERSLDMVVSFLGTLQAGGAYVPIDPDYPQARIEYMLQDSQAPFLLTHSHLTLRLPARDGATVIYLDQPWPTSAEEDCISLPVKIDPDQLAYVIYTSGSTGKPKGVMVTHRGYCNLACFEGAYFGITPAKRILQFASFSFDAACFELAMALPHGAHLYLCRRDTLLSPHQLVQFLGEHRISHATLPPSMLAALPLEPLPELECLLVAGERCHQQLVQRWAVGRRFFNGYGPTESTVCTTLMECFHGGGTPLIGRPIANIQVYILDDSNQPLPVGEVGELCIAGVGLARGYLGRPDLTAERFVEAELLGRKLRIYKTGDLARWVAAPAADAATGEKLLSLDFIGRKDDQVKLRGFRIELGEIETVLSRHQAVRDSAVVLHQRDDNQRLVAYVTLHGGLPEGQASGQELRAWTKDFLPDYMVPSAFVVLDEMPYTPNGKVDRQQLTPPESLRPESSQPLIAPRNETERELVRILEELLGVEPIGVYDDFFILGGHSLLAGRLLARVRKDFCRDITFSELFEEPTAAALARLIQQQAGASDRACSLEFPPRPALLPALPAQERVFFLQALMPSMTAYQCQERMTLKGILDVAALERGLSEIVARHEIYRTTFPSVDGRLVQEIHPPHPVRLPVIDLRGLEEVEQEVERLTEQAMKRPLAIDQLPLIHWTLLQLKDDEHLLIHVEHHMVHDGWSFQVFLGELLALYETYTQGRPSPLTQPPPQFADYACWQNAWLATDAAAQQLAYWTKKLSGCPPLLELPYDRPRPARQTFDGEKLRLDLPLELCQALRQLGREQHATLFMTMFAAFLVLMYRYSGQTDLCIGSGVANRNATVLEGMIGMIVNTLVIRTDLSGDPSFVELLAQVREVTLEAYARTELPFDKVVEALKPQRDLSYNPLFQAVFSFHDAQQPELKLPGLEVVMHDSLSNHTAKFDLNVVVIPRAEQRRGQKGHGATGTLKSGDITLVWEYNSDLFDGSSIQRMMTRYQALVEEIVSCPSSRISGLALMTNAEWQRLAPLNLAEFSFPRESTVVQLFEDRAQAQPEQSAFVSGGQSLSYRELNERANRLAHRLIAMGIGRESLVAICAERSPELAVGLLGILKAGGAYLPLDPSYPPARLEFMLSDSGVRLLLSQSHLLEHLPRHSTMEILCLDGLEEGGCADNPNGRANSDDLAYVIYTSGSTGQPKGVMIGHRGLTNLVCWYGQLLDMGGDDRTTLLASVGFDASALELWPALCFGGAIHVVPAPLLVGGAEFGDWLGSTGITKTFMPTPLLESLLGANWRATSIKKIATGGDRLHNYLPNDAVFQLYNAYGPTECTIIASCGEVVRRDAADPEFPGIGIPIANTGIFILDAQLNPLPIGIPGELCITGAGLARGYLNRPELTAEKFVEVTLFGQRYRVYRTGDRARWRDGKQPSLEFLGRMDSQVKLRGFRIETGEIEAMLMQHAAVREASVQLYGQDGNARLVAYIVTESEAAAPGDELRAWLKNSLPQYMIPADFVVMDSLPLTANGKLDRRALPPPSAAACSPVSSVGNALEQEIAQLWQQVLNIDAVGAHDRFFDIGGHSLLMPKVQGRLEARFQVTIPIVKLFEYPTVHALAGYIAGLLGGLNIDAPVSGQAAAPQRRIQDDIAIIGMAGRFPGASDLDAFWHNLRNGVESIRFFDKHELLREGIPAEWIDSPHYVKAAGVLTGVEMFDAQFFGYTPKQARITDPQHRLFLETAWQTVENAGYDVERISVPVGVFAGVGNNTYLTHNLMANSEIVADLDFHQQRIANEKDFVATSTAYKLNLKGPAVTVQTACSTSLVAVHLACRSLLAGECGMALAGGASVSPPQIKGYWYKEGMIASKDGHCRAFDADAAGTVGGNGVGAVLLKPLEQALQDGDTIHALIKASAINNDGAVKVGFTAPSVAGQAAAISTAMAGLDYESIGYIEAHGTGTAMGDPMEIAALAQSYGPHTGKKGYCAIGSVKTNIGHLNAAAGIAGLIKTVLALQHREIPPSLHFRSPNPKCCLEATPFYVSAALAPWPEPPGQNRRAGVSSFGIGGSNAHAVLEEAPLCSSPPDDGASRLVCLSARTDTALRALLSTLVDHIEAHPDLSLADVAFTLNTGRKVFAQRLALVASSLGGLRDVLLRALALDTLADPAADSKCDEQAETLRNLGRQWMDGANLDWPAFYAGEKRLRLPLPSYPFERQSYWIDPSPHRNPGNHRQESAPRKVPLENWLYLPRWQQSVPLSLAAETQRLTICRWMVLADMSGIGHELVQALRQRGDKVVTVQAGDEFRIGQNGGYTIDAANPADYRRLFDALERQGDMPQAIVHAWGITDELEPTPENVDRIELQNFFGLLHLAQALGGRITEQLHLYTLSNQAHPAPGTTRVHPGGALQQGPIRAIGGENPAIRCKAIDVALPDSDAAGLIAAIIDEFLAADATQLVAYRQGERWLRCFEPMRVPAAPETPPLLKEQGVYLITGGLGGIGLSLAKYLAQTVRARLILTGRTPLPSKENWADYLTSSTEDDPLCRKMRKIEHLEALGGEVLTLAADVCSSQDMETVLAEAIGRFGRIDGIIHAAGLPGDGVIQRKTRDAAANVLSSKVQGSLVIGELAQHLDGLDFLLFCSSLSSVLGTASGQIDYCAANAFVDSYAWRLRSRGLRAASINWDVWQQVGMAEHACRDATGFRQDYAETVHAFGITPEEGMEAFGRMLGIMAKPAMAQILVSTRDWHSRSREPSVANRDGKQPQAVPAGNSGADIEKQLAAIWQGLLGVEEIHSHDDFFTLGGDSLVATQLASKIAAVFQVGVPFKSVFDHPVLQDMAAYIESRKDLAFGPSRIEPEDQEMEEGYL